MNGTFMDVIQLLFVLIGIAGLVVAGFVFLKRHTFSDGGNLKPAVTMAAVTLVAGVLAVALPL